jgi:RND family efflux transporter MFP subunit
VSGQLTKLPVKNGQRVSRGQILARLDPRDFEIVVEREQAKVRASEAEYQRQKELFAQGIVARRDEDLARRNFEVAQANLKAARKSLDDAVLRAPFAGIVANVLVDDFQVVQAKQTIVVLQNPAGLEVAVNVPEADVVRAKRGLTVAERNERVKPRLKLASTPDREIPARLTEMATAADPVARTYEAILSFDLPKDLTVLPGMTVTLVIDFPKDLAAEVGVSIPANAVFSDEQGDAAVWRLNPETMTVHRTAVSLGELSGGLAEITAGLDPGDEIAISGINNLREGMQVSRTEG